MIKLREEIEAMIPGLADAYGQLERPVHLVDFLYNAMVLKEFAEFQCELVKVIESIYFHLRNAELKIGAIKDKEGWIEYNISPGFGIDVNPDYTFVLTRFEEYFSAGPFKVSEWYFVMAHSIAIVWTKSGLKEAIKKRYKFKDE